MTIWITVSLILWMSVIKGIYTTHFGSWFVYTKLQTVTKSQEQDEQAPRMWPRIEAEICQRNK